MRPEYKDVFLKAERFVFLCNLCGAMTTQDGMQLHGDDHERRDWNNWNGESNG